MIDPYLRFLPDINGKLIVGTLELSDLICQPKNEELWQEMGILQQRYIQQFAHPSEGLSFLRPARDLYRAVGIEPTRIRPSSEALFRRVIKRKALYQINSIVDACNYASLFFFLPIGLYDLRKISGDIQFRLGLENEEYEGIGKESVHVANRLCLSDDIGAFGNPSSDSMRTAIDLLSREVLIVIFAPFNYSEIQLQEHMKLVEEIMLKFHPAGKLQRIQILR
jgi:DNA/RNA-binding domain of Phe-tRNA-synthetase-like protein